MKKLYFLILGLIVFSSAYSQIPGKQWDKTFGGSGKDSLVTSIQTSDGGYLLGGFTSSAVSGDITEAAKGGNDFWVVKTNASGAKLWEKRYGGSADDYLFALVEVSDGYWLAGHTYSDISGDVSEANRGTGTNDYWIVKVNKDTGQKLTDKRYGGSGNDFLVTMIATADNGLLLGGTSNSPVSGEKTQAYLGTTANYDYWTIKVNSAGVKQWDSDIGTLGGYNDFFQAVVRTNDGGYLIGGYYPFDGDTDDHDFLVVKMSADGEYTWDKNFGSSNNDYLTSITAVQGGGFLLGGYSNSTNDSKGGYDYYVVRTSPVNSIEEESWSKHFGGSSDDFLTSVIQTNDGGFLLAGYSFSGLNGDKSEAARGKSDFWTVKISTTGSKVWDKRYGGSENDYLTTMVKTSDAGYLLGGLSASGSGSDKAEASKGAGDFWSVKLSDAPVVTALSPANGVTGVLSASNLVMTFSETVQKGTGNIIIKSAAQTLETIPVSNAIVTIADNTVTINPVNDLPGGTDITVQIPAGVFKDLTNNNYAGTSTWTFKTATNADVLPPTVTAFSPADGTTSVEANTSLSITFNENVQKGTGNILIKNGATTLQTIAVTSEAVIINGSSVTIDLPVELTSGITVNIQIAVGAFKDQAGNNYAGIANETTWNFTTVDDITAPAFVSPTPSVSNIGTTTLNIDVKLNESGKVYYVMIRDGDPAPTALQIKSGQNSSGSAVNVKGSSSVTANTTVSIAVTNLASATPYDIYLIAEDNKPNLQPTVTKIDIVTLAPDTQSPTVTTFSPLKDAVSVALDANLVITFSENVKAGTGSISINAAGNTVQTLGVRENSIVSIAGNVVTINPPNDLPLNKVIDIQMPAGVFTDNAGNKFTGILNSNTWTFTTVALQITQSTLPNLLTSTGGTIASSSASITLNQFPAGSSVHFYSKSISRESFTKKENLTPSSGTTFTEALQDKNPDEIGLQYYFEIEPATGFGTKFNSAVTTASIKYTDGLAIPPLLSGTEQKDYQIISIPLELTDKTTSNVFKALGAYNDTKWRLFSHLNSSDTYQENTKGLSSIEPGTGYWLIMKDNTAINTGEGATFRKNTDDPFTITLKPGWNLIGNPYNLDVSWTDVKTANNNLAGLGNLRVFETGSFKDSDVLKKFRGAFVRNDSQADMVIKIPVKRNTTLNGNRIAAPMRHHENSLFEVNFSLHSREVNYQLGGLGMHPEAKAGKDRLDDFVLPRFLKYLDLHFPKAGEGKDKLTKDMVPVADSHIWDFSVNTNLSSQPVTLNWENYLNHPAENQLYLYDVERKISINMLQQQTYTFLAKPLTAFKVYYGKPDFISQHIRIKDAGAYSYPNPFTESAIITFALPAAGSSYSVQMPVYNTLGQQVANLTQGIYSHGFHQVSWNGKDALGNKVPTGVYTCQIQATAEDRSKLYTIRLVVK